MKALCVIEHIAPFHFIGNSYEMKSAPQDAQLAEMKDIASQCLRSTSVVAELMSPGHHATLAREDFASEILFYDGKFLAESVID